MRGARALEDVVVKAMAVDPADRFPDMAAFAAALRNPGRAHGHGGRP